MLSRLGTRSRGSRLATFVLAFLALILVPSMALAGRSGGSFGGRSGFRSGGGFSSGSGSYSGGGYGRSYGGGYSGGGSHFFFLPSWGYGGYGYGGGSFLGTLFVMAIAGIAVVAVMRAVRRSRSAWFAPSGYEDYDNLEDGVRAAPGRAYLYKVQLALGRSGRGIQERLSDFASRGDTNTEAGLASMLQQTSLELLREKDAIRYAQTVGQGPMSLTNAETTMNGLALAERSRFQVERVRAADGRVNKSAAVAEEGKEALELIVVTMVVATRNALPNFKAVTSPAELQTLLSELGTVSPDGLLGLEVIWTPADPNDSMTETDVMTTYPELRGI
jgi:uncharacterized membrane protein